MYNLGVAHLYGFGVSARDPDLATEWFIASGLPEGMHVAAMARRRAGFPAEADEWEVLTGATTAP